MSAKTIPESARSKRVVAKVKPQLVKALKEKGLAWGDEVFVRIFKEERKLELWMRGEKDEKFKLFRRYHVAGMSGHLGPKLKEGDRYPNAYDRGRGRTGSFIMVHGSRWSIGCFAMTDAKIEEIYALCEAALKARPKEQAFFRVHVFPFKMTEERMAGGKAKKWDGFWGNLQEGYEWFEEKKIPPNVTVKEGRYEFD